MCSFCTFQTWGCPLISIELVSWLSAVSCSSFSHLSCYRLKVYFHWGSQCVCGPGLYSLWSLISNSHCWLLQIRSLLLLHHQWRQSRERRAHEAYTGCTTGWQDILAWLYAGRNNHTTGFMHVYCMMLVVLVVVLYSNEPSRRKGLAVKMMLCCFSCKWSSPLHQRSYRFSSDSVKIIIQDWCWIKNICRFQLIKLNSAPVVTFLVMLMIKARFI